MIGYMKIGRRTTNTQAHRNRTTDPYYGTKQHKDLRKQAYLRDRGKCLTCGKDVALHTSKENREYMAFGDHEIPKDFAEKASAETIMDVAMRAGVPMYIIHEVIEHGPNTLDNYSIKCGSCHDAKSNKDKKYYG